MDEFLSKNANALDENNTYAKALSDCTLYKSQEMIDDIESIYFQVPETYFVMIIETINEECLKVKYDRFVGFVNVSRIEEVSFIPIVKFLSDVTFDIKSSSGTQVWKLPLAGSEICTMIPAGTKKINYIASVKGAVPSSGESNLWYYVSYTPDYDSTSVYEGYVYSENTTNLTEIVSNKETNPVNISDEFEPEKLLYISSTIKTIVVAVIAIPIILFFVIILYKLIKKFKNNTKYNKNFNKLKDENLDNFDKTQNLKCIEKYKNMKLLKHKSIEPKFNEFDDEDLL